MKLYMNPLSTYSHKVMIAFNEKGIPYTPEVVDLASPDARAAYEKINPLGKVPFLKPADDYQVPESTAIIEYLEDNFPGTPQLIPTDREGARQVRFMDRMADLYFNDAVTELLLQSLGLRAADDARADRARKHIALTYHYWEQRLAKQSWLCGEAFSMADCAAIPALFYARAVAPFAERPNVTAYWRRAEQRPAYARVRAVFEPIWESVQQRVA